VARLSFAQELDVVFAKRKIDAFGMRISAVAVQFFSVSSWKKILISFRAFSFAQPFIDGKMDN
jgi:hypothetical protein